jgi:RNA polymerase sigma-70 factor (ECF subfamily)
MPPTPPIPGNCHCPTTRWSIVQAAAHSNDTNHKAALETLCLQYWYPIYAFIRRQGAPEASAEDLTQAFFAHILGNRFLLAADPQKGSFKAYLLESCRNFLRSEQKTRRHEIMNGPLVSLDALRDAAGTFALEPPSLDPGSGFDLDFAFAVLTNALEAVRRRYADRGRAALFDRLRAYLPFHKGELPRPQAAAAAEGGQSVGAYKKALHDLRAAFAKQVRHEMAQTLSDPAEVEKEIRNLLDNVRRMDSAARVGQTTGEACK